MFKASVYALVNQIIYSTAGLASLYSWCPDISLVFDTPTPGLGIVKTRFQGLKPLFEGLEESCMAALELRRQCFHIDYAKRCD
jgi:hypothetical protein